MPLIPDFETLPMSPLLLNQWQNSSTPGLLQISKMSWRVSQITVTYPWGLRLIPGIERHEMNLAEDVAMVWETHLIVFSHGAVPMVFRLALPKTAPSCQEMPVE